MLVLYLAILTTGLYYVAKILSPEMRRTPLPRKPAAFDPLDFSTLETPENRIGKLEILLFEKNKNIQLLQSELKVSLVQIRNFDKVKVLLEEEIRRLREQNRIFRSELGLPTIEAKENSTRLFL